MSSESLPCHDVLPCDRCHEVWKCPRTLAFQPENLPGSLPEVDPYTTDTIVAYETFESRGRNPKPTFSRQFFENIRFTHNAPRGFFGSCGSRGQYRLVKSFDYTDDEIFYKKTDREANYGQLITLNSWYEDLSSCLLFALLLAMDHVSSACFCLWTLGAGNFELPPIILAVACVLRLMLELRVSTKAAKWLWFAKTNATSGDLIVNLGPSDRRYAYLATTLLIFLEVPGSVRDIVIHLHPWKAVQPYAAFKCEGHRATVIGHKNRIDYRVADSGGLHRVQHCRLITKLATIAGQVAVVFWIKNRLKTSNIIMIAVMIFMSTVVACMYGYRSYRTQSARNACHRNLVKFFYNTAGMHDAHIKIQRRVASRNLAVWYHQQIREDKEHLLKITTLDFKQYEEDFEDAFNGCLGCGRSKELKHQTKTKAFTSRPDKKAADTKAVDLQAVYKTAVPIEERPALPEHLVKKRQADLDSTFALPPDVKLQADLDEELQHFSMEEGTGTLTEGAPRVDAPRGRQGLSHQQLEVPRKDSLEYSRKLNRSEATEAAADGDAAIQGLTPAAALAPPHAV